MKETQLIFIFIFFSSMAFSQINLFGGTGNSFFYRASGLSARANSLKPYIGIDYALKSKSKIQLSFLTGLDYYQFKFQSFNSYLNPTRQNKYDYKLTFSDISAGCSINYKFGKRVSFFGSIIYTTPLFYNLEISQDNKNLDILNRQGYYRTKIIERFGINYIRNLLTYAAFYDFPRRLYFPENDSTYKISYLGFLIKISLK